MRTGRRKFERSGILPIRSSTTIKNFQACGEKSERIKISDICFSQLDITTHRLQEARSDLGRGRSPNGILEMGVGLGVVELDGADAAKVVEIPGELGVASALRENTLGNKLVGLVEEIMEKVVAEEEVNEHRL